MQAKIAMLQANHMIVRSIDATINMRTLRTSNWRLGQHFTGKTRQDEHRTFVAWLADQYEVTLIDSLQFRQIAAQVANNEVWQRLNSLIGCRAGGNFHKFSQWLTLNRLTNRYLGRLHGCYLHDHKSIGEVKLKAVDIWQSEIISNARTLFGIESFPVSHKTSTNPKIKWDK